MDDDENSTGESRYVDALLAEFGYTDDINDAIELQEDYGA